MKTHIHSLVAGTLLVSLAGGGIAQAVPFQGYAESGTQEQQYPPAPAQGNQPTQDPNSPTYIAPAPAPAPANGPAYDPTQDPNSPLYIAPAPPEQPTDQAPAPPAPGPQAGQGSLFLVSGTVIPVQLNSDISSATAQVQQGVTATVISHNPGDSELPPGTQIWGTVKQVTPSQNGQPGALDFDFVRIILPDGTSVPIKGRLITLDPANTVFKQGRIMALPSRSLKQVQAIGTGVGAGFVLGNLLQSNTGPSAILTGDGAYLVSQNQTGQPLDATIHAGATLGILIRTDTNVPDTTGYLPSRQGFLQTNPPSTFDPNYYGVDPSTLGNPNLFQYNGFVPSAPPLLVNNSGAAYPPSGYAVAPSPAPQGNYPPANYPPAPMMQPGPAYPPAPGYAPAPAYAQSPAYPPGPGGPQANFSPAAATVITVPDDAVVPVVMDTGLSSATAQPGQRFKTTVVSATPGDSEFPGGTKIIGEVESAHPRTGTDSGELDLKFTEAILPDHTHVPLHGRLISLDRSSVVVQHGRLIATTKKADQAAFIGGGAAAGFVIGRLVHKNGILPSLLGALGGAIIGNNQPRETQEATVPPGTKIGVRIDGPLTYSDDTGYATYRNRFIGG